MQIRLLGPLDLVGAPASERLLAQPKRAALLLYLAVERRRGPVARDTLLALFWPESDEPRARNALNQAVHVLRAALGRDAILALGATQLRLADDVTTDLDAFEAAVAAGRVDAACGLLRGELAEGTHVVGAPDFEHWLDRERHRLRAIAIPVLELAIARHRASAAWPELLETARLAARLDPFDDRWTAIGDEAAENLRAVARDPGAPIAAAPETARADARAEAAAPLAGGDTSADPPGVPRARRPMALLSLIAASVAIAAFAMGGRSPAPTGPPTIAVPAFAVVGDTGQGPLGEAVAALLATSLDGLSELRVAAAASGADYVVRGRVLLDGRQVALVAEVQDARSGRRMAAARSDTLEGGLFASVDRLTTAVAGALVPAAAGRLTAAASRMTTSLPALRAFLEGERFRRAGRYHAAVAAFKAATDLDPEFALAHYRLAITADWANAGDWSRPAAIAAERRADRLSPRYASLLRAARYYLDRQFLAGEDLLLQLVRDYPDEAEAWYLLGELRFHYGPLAGRPLADARDAFQRVVALEPGHAEARLHLVRLDAAAGDGPAAADGVRAMRALAVEHERSLELRALGAFGTGGDRRAVLDDAADRTALEIDAAAKAVAVHADDLVFAESLAVRLTTGRHSDGWRLRALAWMAQLDASRGRWDRAEARLDAVRRVAPAFAATVHTVIAMVPGAPTAIADGAAAALERLGPAAAPVPGEIDVTALPPERRAYFGALLAMRRGDEAAFARHAAVVRDAAQRDASAADYARSLEAAAAWRAGRWGEVVDVLAPTAADVQGPVANGLQMGRAIERWLRLDALWHLGRLDEARAVAGSFPEPAGYDLAYRAAVAGALDARTHRH